MALFENNTLVFESSLLSRQTHSKGLLPMVEQAVESQSGLTVDQIDGFIAARGARQFYRASYWYQHGERAGQGGIKTLCGGFKS